MLQHFVALIKNEMTSQEYNVRLIRIVRGMLRSISTSHIFDNSFIASYKCMDYSEDYAYFPVSRVRSKYITKK